MSVISAPIDLIESMSELKLPVRTDQKLQELMDRNNEGLLNEAELAELETLVEWSQELSLMRARALQVLGRKPK
jgi:hypothetical protein